MKSRIKIKRSPQKALEKLERINKTMKGKDLLKVGLPKGSNDYPDGTSVIMVGTVQEFGSPKQGIPQRSYLRSTMVTERKAYRKAMSKLAKKVVEGELTKKQALGLLGLLVQTDVRDKITDIKEPPLKSRDGNPLVDTGHLRQSITYEVTE